MTAIAQPRARRSAHARLMAWSVAFLIGFVATSHANAAPRLAVEGGHLLLHAENGQLLRGQRLTGAIVALRNRAGHAFELRVEAVEAGPFEDVALYDLVMRRGRNDPWTPLCQPGPDGRARAIAIGSADERGQAESTVSFACTAGARGKCILRGYRPWATNAEGVALAPYYEACVRMMRADYCGDGQSNTRAGIVVDAWDKLGIRSPSSSMPFEAAWGANGAVCIARARAASVAPLATILDRCPALAQRVRADCSDAPGQPGSDALLWNRSGDAP